jgi:hypothetical protein
MSDAARYVLLVDHQPKRSFDRRDRAEEEAQRILDHYPHLRVTIQDCEATPLARTGARRSHAIGG